MENKTSRGRKAAASSYSSSQRRPATRRVLDAGGGSCSLATYMKQHLPSHSSVNVLAFDVGYNCGFHLACSERGQLMMQQSWFDKISVPDGSQDVVFHAQGLHHITPTTVERISLVYDNLLRPLRPGGFLHLSDGDAQHYGQLNGGMWSHVLPHWAQTNGLELVRMQKCTNHMQYLYRKPRRALW